MAFFFFSIDIKGKDCLTSLLTSTAAASSSRAGGLIKRLTLVVGAASIAITERW